MEKNMNSVDMANNLIFRAKHLQEFIVETEVPDDFRFNGVIPFDVEITGSIMSAKVYGVDFNEAVTRLHEWLETCK
jgi:hypothetical protein